MDAYGLSRDDVMEILPLFQYDETLKKDPLKGVESKVKAAFTRKYNSGVHKSQSLHSTALKANQDVKLADLKGKAKKGKAKGKSKKGGKGKAKAS